MAITHEDLSIKKFKYTDTSGKLALFLVIFSVLCGLVAFILCLTAEGSRSEVTWMLTNSTDDTCFYNSSGRTPLACAVVAFLLLAVSMFAEHAFMLVTVTTPQQCALDVWMEQQYPRQISTARDLTWQTCCLFLFTRATLTGYVLALPRYFS